MRRLAALAAGAWLGLGSPCRAEDAPPPDLALDAALAQAPALDVAGTAARSGSIPELSGVTLGTVLETATGFLTAFVVHEGCHAAANLALGNTPTLQPVRFLGFFPFFAVSPGITCRGGDCWKRDGTPFPPGPRGYAFIVSSGIVCQEITDEVILSARPGIRAERAPFLKGMLLFNTATSVAYGIASLAGLEPPEGDLRAFSGVSPVPRGVFAALVIGTAALDVARYLLPESQWLPWVSRGTKAATLGFVVAF